MAATPELTSRSPSVDDIATMLVSFRGVATAMVSDNLSRLPGAVGLRPYHRGGQLIGRALTVRTRAGDNLAIHQAMETLQPGDVVVVDGGGDISRALIGELMVEIALSRGCAGFVIDGAIRDVGTISKGDFPCYARDVTHRGPYKTGPGEVNVAVTVGGMVVSPGDIVLGDEDGVVAFAPHQAEGILRAVRTQEAREAELLASIREGRYSGGYGKPAE